MNKSKLRRYQHLLKGQLHELAYHSQGVSALLEMPTTVDTEASADPNDRASAETDRNFDLLLRDRDSKLLSKIKDALGRIDDGSYGKCTACGGTIGERRLQARPVTTLCLECKEETEQLRRRT